MLGFHPRLSSHFGTPSHTPFPAFSRTPSQTVFLRDTALDGLLKS